MYKKLVNALSDGPNIPHQTPCYDIFLCIIKAAFHLRVFYTHVNARKNLNPSTVHIFEKYVHR